VSWRGANGLRPWLVQRLSAVYMAGFVTFVLVNLAGTQTIGFEAWRGWVAGPLVNAALALFVVALLSHAWVGTRDVVLDYVKPVGLRMVLLTLFALFFLLLLFWGLRVLLSVSIS